VYCWQRAGLYQHEIQALLEALIIESGQHSLDRLKVLEAKNILAVKSPPEPVTEGVLVRPTPETDKAKTIEEWWARNPAVKTDSTTGRAIAPVEAQAKPPVPAKKAKRARRRKK